MDYDPSLAFSYNQLEPQELHVSGMSVAALLKVDLELHLLAFKEVGAGLHDPFGGSRGLDEDADIIRIAYEMQSP